VNTRPHHGQCLLHAFPQTGRGIRVDPFQPGRRLLQERRRPGAARFPDCLSPLTSSSTPTAASGPWTEGGSGEFRSKGTLVSVRGGLGADSPNFHSPEGIAVKGGLVCVGNAGNDRKLKGSTPMGGNIVSIGTTDSSKLKGLVPSQNPQGLLSLSSEPNKVCKRRIRSDESQRAAVTGPARGR
jgi:hypothetical protein